MQPNLQGQTARPLRYWPQGTDFVITNGGEFFNRPLYCMNSAFRIDGGDRPEFSLYLPGRGGNLRFGIKTASGAKWLHEVATVVTRYRPGALIYQLGDPLLGNDKLLMTVLPMNEAKGLIARVEVLSQTTAPASDNYRRSHGKDGRLKLICAFGGANGMRGRRGGDIGCEREPVSRFFQLRPEQCRNNHFIIQTNGFVLLSKVATLTALASAPATFIVADANCWTNLNELLESTYPRILLTPGFSQVPTDTNTSASASTASGVGTQTVQTVTHDLSTTTSGSRFNASEPAAPALELPIAVGVTHLSEGKPVYVAVWQIAPESSATEVPQLTQAYTSKDLPVVLEKAENYRREIANRVVAETPDPFLNAAFAALCVAADAIWDEQQGVFMHGAVAWRSKLLGWRGPYAGDALGWHDRARRHFAYWAGQQVTNPVPEKMPPPDAESNLARSHTALHSNGALSTRHYDMNLVYVDALLRHLLWTGDLEFARWVWPVLERHFAWERRLFRRPFGNGTLPLYEAYAAIWASDDIQYHGGGVAYTSAYNFWHNKMAARLARALGKDPTQFEREAELICNAMRELLWLKQHGWFAEFKDWLGLRLVHPSCGIWTVYHTIDSEAATPIEAWQLTRYIDTQIPRIPIHGPNVPPEGLFTISTTTWMPYTWSVNNVVMAEALHTALAYWQANRPDTAFRLFKGAILDSMYMGLCPGNLGMTTPLDVARREAQRDFADAVGVCARALVEGLFGIRPDALAGELFVCPGFPAQWNRARIRHPDFELEYNRDGLTETYAVIQRFPKPMNLRLWAPAMRTGVKMTTINDKPAHWRTVENAVGLPRIEITAPARTTHKIIIEWRGKSAATGSITLQPMKLTEKLRFKLTNGRLLEIADPQGAIADVKLASTGFSAKAVGQPGHYTIFAKVNIGQLTWWTPVLFEVQPVQVVNEPMPIDWRVPLPHSTRFETVDLTTYFNDAVTQIFRNEYVSPRSPFCSLAMPKQGIGGWATCNLQFNVDDSGLRAAAATNGGKIFMPNGVPFVTPTNSGAKNIIFVSQWDNYPDKVTLPLAGRARRAFLLMAGSTNPMQSRFDNGEVIVTYADGSTARLPLHNPTTWWPIDQDYFIDDYAFRRPEPIPPRIDLKTGKVRILEPHTFMGKGGKVDGGAATVLDLPLEPNKDLHALTVRALANEVVIGVMAVTLQRQ